MRGTYPVEKGICHAKAENTGRLFSGRRPVYHIGLRYGVNGSLDTDSLAGLTTGKAVFDIRTKEPGRLFFTLKTLKVIEETAASMKAQEVTPDFILTFRGVTVPLLKVNPNTANDAELAMLSEVRKRPADYRARARGMVLEACNVAASIFKVEEKQLDPSVHLIGNSLISLIGYRDKGYAVVPMS